MKIGILKWSAVAILAACSSLLGSDREILWQIGEPNGSGHQFALSPRDWKSFHEDSFYIIGESTPRQDWSYVHPGPSDSWAGRRRHTFIILFGLKEPPAAGDCRFLVRLTDTHYSGPPKLAIRINGREFERAMPAGASEGSIEDPSKGRPYEFEIAFPSSLLRKGNNDIQISTLRGSWLLYDSLRLETPAGAGLEPVKSRTVIQNVQAVPALSGKSGQFTQPVLLTLLHRGEPKQVTVRVGNAEPQSVRLERGERTLEFMLPAVKQPEVRQITVADGEPLATRDVTIKPVRRLTVYVLPHSHTDIGYTEIQTAIEKRQVQNLLDGIAFARRTAQYPEGSRFVWNVEVLWAADLYLHRLNEQQRTDFLDAVKKKQVVLNGMYLNELTGLCRPEELIRLFKYATRLSGETGVPIDSVMISDVPGYTWGTVTAMAQAGIKYFSTAPNYFDRIGTIMREWENKPFYWVGPDGKSKVLVWIPFWGYGMSHLYHDMSVKLVADLYAGLEDHGYPYDIAYVRWSGHGDNAVPDPTICDFIKDWNAKYAWPKFIISGTGEAFQAFEKQYGDKLSAVRGDWTPYWEDGAGSSALETAMNRQSSDRLSQAETLFAMKNPSAYPAADFEEAWKHILLYSEHTWGANVSVSRPESKKTIEQWQIKKGYAEQADSQSRELLERALRTRAAAPAARSGLEVVNTLSWPRTQLVVLSREQSSAGDRVTDAQGRPVPSQRLSSGELAFLAGNVPEFGSRRYRITAGAPYAAQLRATAGGTTLESGIVRVRVDERSGGIVELAAQGIQGNFADTSGGESLNEYLYLPGDNLADLKRNGPVKISVGEKGPLVASLILESEAPGCNRLRRELRVVAGQDHVEVVNLVDKARLQARSYMAKEGKESVNFAFPFHVPDGDMVLDIPLAAMRPEQDQIASACKNWFVAGRWADVSSKDRGVTWVTLDAPLLQVGGLTARLLNSQTNPDVWRAKVERTQKLYAWVMNNHWGTNYRAYQEGPTTFRFILRPHRAFDAAEATRFATGFSQPLLAQAAGRNPVAPRLKVDSADVVVTALKPSDDGGAWIVRLFGASGKPSAATLQWGSRRPKAVYLSDTSEKPGRSIAGAVSVPAYGVVTLRAQFE